MPKTLMISQLRSCDDLQHDHIAECEIVAMPVRPNNMVWEKGTARLQAGESKPGNLSEQWNERMDKLGARRGTWKELATLVGS